MTKRTNVTQSCILFIVIAKLTFIGNSTSQPLNIMWEYYSDHQGQILSHNLYNFTNIFDISI